MVTKIMNANLEILILGAGWTSTFLIPLLEKAKITYAATTTTGRDHTYEFKFEFEDATEKMSDDSWKQLATLPLAKTILITFPLKSKAQTSALYKCYVECHSQEKTAHQFIQLGSTGIFQTPDQDCWVTRHSKYDKSNARAIAEDELLQLGGCVLNLSGLWGGERKPIHWIDRVASTKEKLAEKKSLHMVHGQDVARGIIAVHQKFHEAKGQRFMLTDLFVYDWWALILGYSGQLDAENGDHKREESQIKWIGELMEEQKARALPRSGEELARCYDSREFWTTFGLMPVRARI